MLNINWSDVVSMLELLRQYLITAGVIIAVLIIVIIAVMKLERKRST